MDDAPSQKPPRRFRQAFWDEPLLSQIGRKGRLGFAVPEDPKIREWAKAKGDGSLIPRSVMDVRRP